MLVDELDQHIKTEVQNLADLRDQMSRLRCQLSGAADQLEDALRLYRSLAGQSHPLQSELSIPTEQMRRSPRLDQVLAVFDRHRGPVSLDELVEAMPDAPERGAVSAAVHRAIKRGEVRSLDRGLYERIGGRST